MTNIVKSTG